MVLRAGFKLEFRFKSGYSSNIGHHLFEGEGQLC